LLRLIAALLPHRDRVAERERLAGRRRGLRARDRSDGHDE
jgi:hypothetical protein